MKKEHIQKLIDKLDQKLLRIQNQFDETQDHRTVLYQQLDLFKNKAEK